ncbi:MAG: hypothetical protein IOD12_01245 [Silvanigrellales bacterium]|jgi:hypothetical protein|nr:hypothetical protein [Silvanigrellales bacterium]
MTDTSYAVRGIEYLRIVGIPTRETPWGPAWTIELVAIERLFASALIRLRVPLRGIELKYLRKVLGLSLVALGEQLGVSDVTVLNWEKAEEKRLDLATEVAMRAYFAERLGVVLEGTLSALRGTDAAPEVPVELPAVA